MNQETLQRLISAHNTLFSLSVTGDAIVPVAQVLLTLNGVICDMAEEMKSHDTTVKIEAVDQPINENMEEQSV